MPQFRIRTATPADVPCVLEFIKELAAYERLSHEVVADEAALSTALFGAGSNAEALLAELIHETSVEPIGFAVFFHNFSTFLGRKGLYLEDLFVRPAHRGGGYGKALLAHLAGIAVARGCRRFEWAVLDWNAPAIRFYEALGAKPNADWTVYRLDGAALGALAAVAPQAGPTK